MEPLSQVSKLVTCSYQRNALRGTPIVRFPAICQQVGCCGAVELGKNKVRGEYGNTCLGQWAQNISTAGLFLKTKDRDVHLFRLVASVEIA